MATCCVAVAQAPGAAVLSWRGSSSTTSGAACVRLVWSNKSSSSSGGVVVECSSRPQKKCTAHHNKTRPKKHSLSDKNRKPTQYPRPPKAPPIVGLYIPPSDVVMDTDTASASVPVS